MPVTDQVLGDTLRIMSRLVTEVCQRNSIAEACATRVTRNQFMILELLSTQPAGTVSEIARVVHLSCAAASKNVDRLEQLGLVRRLAKPEDRRGLEVAIRPRGRRVVDAHARIVAAKQAAGFAELDAEDKQRLLDYLRRIIRATIAREPGSDEVCHLCDGRGRESCVVAEQLGACARDGAR